MQNFTTEHESGNANSTIEIQYLKGHADLTGQCRWIITSTHEKFWLPKAIKFYGLNYRIPYPEDWNFVEHNEISNVGDRDMPRESRKLMHQIIENLSKNKEIMIEEIKEFHRNRIQGLEEKASYWQRLLGEEVKNMVLFCKEWE